MGFNSDGSQDRSHREDEKILARGTFAHNLLENKLLNEEVGQKAIHISTGEFYNIESFVVGSGSCNC